MAMGFERGRNDSFKKYLPFEPKEQMSKAGAEPARAKPETDPSEPPWPLLLVLSDFFVIVSSAIIAPQSTH